jgi:hypothetical protein
MVSLAGLRTSINHHLSTINHQPFVIHCFLLLSCFFIFVQSHCMSAAEKLDPQINNYLSQLNTQQKKAVLTVVKTFAAEQQEPADYWNDPDFVAEIKRRTRELENGSVAGIPWDTAKTTTG